MHSTKHNTLTQYKLCPAISRVVAVHCPEVCQCIEVCFKVDCSYLDSSCFKAGIHTGSQAQHSQCRHMQYKHCYCYTAALTDTKSLQQRQYTNSSSNDY
jgi:hypothetical protein